eukprot:scaffold6096_cov39-Cyclotella_meneghiniana.AAC.11
MDMRFYWLKDREAQNFFQFHWKRDFIKARRPRKTKTQAKGFIKSSCGKGVLEMPVSYYWQFPKDTLSYDIKEPLTTNGHQRANNSQP